MKGTTHHRSVSSISLLLGLALAAVGCEDPLLPSGPRIDHIDPGEAAPGQVVRLEGDGFGAHPGAVAIGGRPMAIRGWSAGTIDVEVPPETPSGATLVVVKIGGRTSPPAPLAVLGDQRRLDAGRRFPGRADASPRPEMGPPPPRDMDPPPPDGGPPPAELVAEFTADPVRGDAVALLPLPSPPGSLVLEVRIPGALVPQTLGVALHLAYDGNLLRFRRADPQRDDLPVREIGPGRLALGSLEPREGLIVTLTFDLAGRGEARVDVPRRHRALRDLRNQPLPVQWAGGSVRVQEAP